MVWFVPSFFLYKKSYRLLPCAIGLRGFWFGLQSKRNQKYIQKQKYKS